MPKIDLYLIHKLDRRQPPEALAAQLSSELNSTDPRDTLMRSRIETARVILGDPQRRAAYDRQLDDPSTPELTEQTLSQLSGQPAATAPRRSVTARPLAIIAAATVVLLVVGIVLVVTLTGGDDDKGNTAAAARSTSGTSTANDDAGESPRNPAKVGQTVTAAGLDWTVTRVEKIDNHGQVCNGLALTRYVVAVTVDIDNAGARTQDVPPFNMQYLRFKSGQPRFANCVTDPANGLPIKPGQPKRTLTYYFAMMPPQIAQIQQVELISEDSDAPHAFVALDDLGPSPAGWPPMNSSDKQIDDSFDLGGLTTKVTGAGAVDDPRCPGANYRVQVFARNENISAKPMPTAAGSPLKTSAGQVAGTCAFVGDIGTPAPTTIAPNQSVYLKLYYRVADPSTVQAVVIGGQVTVAIW